MTFFRRNWPIVAWLASFALIAVGVFQVSQLAERVESQGQGNRDLSCAISRLVAHVPAVQFEGESLSNFIGWVRSRRDMLAIAEDGQCSRRTQLVLERRVELDTDLLKTLRR